MKIFFVILVFLFFAQGAQAQEPPPLVEIDPEVLVTELASLVRWTTANSGDEAFSAIHSATENRGPWMVLNITSPIELSRVITLKGVLQVVAKEAPQPQFHHQKAFLLNIPAKTTAQFAFQIAQDGPLPSVLLWHPQVYADLVERRTLMETILLAILGLCAAVCFGRFCLTRRLTSLALCLFALSALLTLWVQFRGPPLMEDILLPRLTLYFLAGTGLWFAFLFFTLGIRWRLFLGLLLIVIAATFWHSLLPLEVVLGTALGLGVWHFVRGGHKQQAILFLPGLAALCITAFLWFLLPTTNPFYEVALGCGLAVGVFLWTLGLFYSGGSSPRLALALHAAGLGLWEWEVDSNRLFVAPRLEGALGAAPGSLCGNETKWRGRIHPSDLDAYVSALAAYVASGGATFRLQFRMRTDRHEYRWFELQGMALPDRHGTVARCIGLAGDITNRKRDEAQLLRAAVRDSLTDLPGRALLTDTIERMMEKTPRGITLALISLNRFKNINEELGHQAGDTVLLEMAHRLQDLCEDKDMPARIGGDEFALLLSPRTTPLSLELMLDILKAPLRLGKETVFPSPSIGVATTQVRHHTAEHLFREAEAALAQARSAKSASVQTFTPHLHRRTSGRLLLEGDLRRALEQDELEIFYQPIVRLKNKQIAGLEALLRWRHPERGLILPGEFIPPAQEMGLMGDLTTHTLYTACHALSRWQQKRSLFVSVNISSDELFDETLAQNAQNALQQTHLSPHNLKLEITESLIMQNPEAALHVLEPLREAGISLAVDDFGSGYSNFSYLHRLPLNLIKVDRALIDEDSGEEHSQAILRAVIRLSRDLQMEVVGEGVDNERKLRRLENLGCDYGQGFYLCPPMSVDEVPGFLSKHRNA